VGRKTWSLNYLTGYKMGNKFKIVFKQVLLFSVIADGIFLFLDIFLRIVKFDFSNIKVSSYYLPIFLLLLAVLGLIGAVRVFKKIKDGFFGKTVYGFLTVILTVIIGAALNLALVLVLINLRRIIYLP
jgi:hypothetical protein